MIVKLYVPGYPPCRVVLRKVHKGKRQAVVTSLATSTPRLVPTAWLTVPS